MMRTTGGDRGVVLILVSAVVGLVLLFSFLLVGFARSMRLRSAAVLGAVQVRQTAVSGAEYAAARLAAEGRPLESPTSLGRGDDWTERQGSGIRGQGSENPSYSHGEAWLDTSAVADGIDNDADGEIDEASEIDRIFAPGEAHRDLDGDGRFSAWSGRLRGGRGSLARRFALRIGGAEGGIPLNAGVIAAYGTNGLDDDQDGLVDEWNEQVGDLEGMCGSDGRDNDGDRLVDEADETVPDYRDDIVPYHASLAMALNNLGVITGVQTRRWDVPAGRDEDVDGRGDHPVQACWIGTDLIRSRPVGGYRSWAEVEDVLMHLPADPPQPSGSRGAPYQKADLDAIRPFVDLGPYEMQTGMSRDSARYAPINLWTAPPEVLEAVWMYLTAASPLAEYAPTSEPRGVLQWRMSNDLVGAPPSPAVLCPHSGAPFSTVPGAPSPVLLILWPGEARSLAREMRLARQDPASPFTWESMRRRFLERAREIFPEDAKALEDADPAFSRSWLGMKASLAFQAVAMDPYPFRGCHDGLATWSSWGLDGDPSLAGVQIPLMIGMQGIYRILYPPVFAPAFPPGWSPAGDPWPPYTADPFGSSRMIHPQGFTLAAPVRFTVESRGWLAPDPGGGAVVEGRFRAAERLELASQEDFESFRDAARLTARGVAPLEIPGAAERHGCAPGAQAGATIVSLPRANQRGFDVQPGFSRLCGALGLAPLEGGRQGAGLYWRMAEDFDGKLNLDPPAPAWQEWWSEWDAANTAAFNPAIPIFLPPYRYPSLAWTDSEWRRGMESPETSTPYKASGLNGGRDYIPDGPISLPDDLKGVRAPWCSGTTIVSGTIPLASIEAWMGPESCLYLEGEDTGSYLYLRTRRTWQAPARPGILYGLRVRWVHPPGNIADTYREWFVPDPASPGARIPLTHHAVLRFQRQTEGTGRRAIKWTRFSLFVDGALVGEHDHRQKFFNPFGVQIGEGGELGNYARTNLNWRSVAEVRLWNGDATPGASARHAAGRYVRTGTFQSPLYALDAPSRLLDAQWTGVTPAAFVDAEGIPINPFTVEVEGFSDARGAVSLGRRPLGAISSDVARLSGLFGRTVRSFRYRVTIDATGLAGVLDETPLFESLWIRLQRKGTAPAWASWAE